MPIITKKAKQPKPARTLIISLLAVIFTGTFLLCLPVSSKDGQWTNFTDSLFTATSATSVTGISIYSTHDHWTLFGQIIIMLMIQIGGLGFLTIVTFFNYAIGRKIGLMKANAVAGEINIGGTVGAKRLFIRIIKYTLTIEIIGAAILGFTFVPEYGAYGIFISLFTAVSSFSNAGFDVFGAKEGVDLNAYIDKPQVLLVMIMLIFLGGIGFVVWDNLANYHKTKKLLMHTKLVLAVSGTLILIGFVVYFLITVIEKEKYADFSLGERILSSFFTSFSARTAGFSVLDLPTVNDFSKLFTVLLMFIGAAPGSTAGGIKVTTIAILAATIMTVLKGKEDVVLLGHRIPKKLVFKSVAVMVLSIMFILISFASIYLINPQLPGVDILYEVVSAFSTTGFSTGISQTFGITPKLILSLTMFVGRVGPVSLLLSLTTDKPTNEKNKVLPDCELLIG